MILSLQNILALSYGFISPPSTDDIENASSAEQLKRSVLESSTEDGPSLANNALEINVYFDTLSEQAIDTKATYTVCQICTFFVVVRLLLSRDQHFLAAQAVSCLSFLEYPQQWYLKQQRCSLISWEIFSTGQKENHLEECT